jgi:hypothetical protein
MARAEVFIELTTEETVVLCDAAQCGLPVAFADDPLGNVPESRHALAKANATRALVARRALQSDETGALKPIDALATILEVSATPGIIGLVTLERVDEDDVDVRTLAVLPELGVEMRKVGANLYRFTPFAPEDLVARIMRLLDLRPAQVPASLAFRASFAALEACGDIVEQGEESLDLAVAALTDDGVASPLAHAFVDALSVRRGSTQIALFHKPADDVMEGGTVTFIDAGLAGYWQTEAADGAGASRPGDIPLAATVRTVDAASLASQVLGFLPEAFGETIPRGLAPILRPVS